MSNAEVDNVIESDLSMNDHHKRYAVDDWSTTAMCLRVDYIYTISSCLATIISLRNMLFDIYFLCSINGPRLIVIKDIVHLVLPRCSHYI